MSRDARRAGHGPERDLGRQAGSAIAFAFAMLLHGLVGIFYISSGLVAPGWAVLVLVAIWIGLGVLLWRWRRRGAVVLTVPFVAAAIWFLVVTAGEQLLGWTA